MRRGADLARSEGVEVVVACGGGSAIDAGKAIAALLGNGGDPLDYLEVVGRGQPLTRPSLPFVAIPTTAGTGSEVTRNAVLASPEHRVKASLRSPLMLARAAIVDPDLLLGLPPPVVAASGLDALRPARGAVRLRPGEPHGGRPLPRGPRPLRALAAPAFEGDSSEAVRVDLALASLFGGLALANAGLGAVHGFAAPVGGMFDAPHGAACAALLPAVLRVNLEALSRRRPESPALGALPRDRGDRHRADGGRRRRRCRVGGGARRALSRSPASRGGGRPRRTSGRLVAKARAASSMKGNPIELEEGELAEIARASL